MCRQSVCRYIDRRENMRKKWISIICAILIMVCTITAPVYAAGIFLPEESNTRQAESTDLIEAPSGILMEAQTGTVVYQKDADTTQSQPVPMQSQWAVLRCFWRRGKSRQWKP